MTRVAIYARYSSDLQSQSSIEDQIRVCRERAERSGLTVINCYTDAGLTGANMLRPGIQMLMQDANEGKFDVVLTEALDRLSRDQEDIAGIYKRLSFAAVKIVTLSEGEVDSLHIGLKGTMNALFLQELANKTRRGLRGRVEAGKSGGGKCYGYDVVRKYDGAGEPIRGERKINPHDATIVKRIYEEYLAGISPKAIATGLNKEGIASPTDKGWGPSTIHGNRQRGTGILNNELYIGKLVWNRLRYIKDPDTGKRISRLNPENEWIIKDVPEQRLIDQELWDAVKTKQGEINRRDTALWQKNRPKHLLASLLKCGTCGGGFTHISKTHVGCFNAKSKGTCDNQRTMKREAIEHKVLTALKDHLMQDELVSVFCDEYTKHMNKLHSEQNAALNSHKKELSSLETKKAKLVQAILDGVPGDELKASFESVAKRRTELEDIIANTDEKPLLFHPSMGQRYRQEVGQLIKTLNEGNRRTETSSILRSLIEQVKLTPDAKGELTVDLIGDLAGILRIATKDNRPLINRGLSVLSDEPSEALVAGVRNHLN